MLNPDRNPFFLGTFESEAIARARTTRRVFAAVSLAAGVGCLLLAYAVAWSGERCRITATDLSGHVVVLGTGDTAAAAVASMRPVGDWQLVRTEGCQR